MGNFWKGISDEELLETERQMLSYSGVDYSLFRFVNVVIDDERNYVRTIHLGEDKAQPDKTKLVLVHGYGASGIIFYKILKPLLEAGLHLILIDILGMGASSRPQFDENMTAEAADIFFVNFMEQWRVAMGDMKGFFLAGHSFGGYVCGNYAAKYPQHIRKLLMLSPVGVPFKPKEPAEDSEIA